MGGWAGRDGLHLSVVAPHGHGVRRTGRNVQENALLTWKCLEVAVCIDEGKNGF